MATLPTTVAFEQLDAGYKRQKLNRPLVHVRPFEAEHRLLTSAR
jgi:hypothetical protein